MGEDIGYNKGVLRKSSARHETYVGGTFTVIICVVFLLSVYSVQCSLRLTFIHLCNFHFGEWGLFLLSFQFSVLSFQLQLPFPALVLLHFISTYILICVSVCCFLICLLERVYF